MRPRARKSGAKRERVVARATAEQKELLERAAALLDQPLSQFVMNSAQRAAEQAIREHDVITLTMRDSRVVMEALRHPEPAGPWLRAAAERYKATMGDG